MSNLSNAAHTRLRPYDYCVLFFLGAVLGALSGALIGTDYDGK